MQKNIIIAGNKKYGLGAALAEQFSQADFCSRSNGGFDFSTAEAREKFALRSLNSEICIFLSCLKNFSQILLLEAVFKKWKQEGHGGYLICIGSTADTYVEGSERLYPIEKRALKEYCKHLRLQSVANTGLKSAIRITYLSTGYLNTIETQDRSPQVKKIDLHYIASILRWLMEQPQEYNLGEICIDPLQIDTSNKLN